jgi:hypothetical protein
MKETSQAMRSQQIGRTRSQDNTTTVTHRNSVQERSIMRRFTKIAAAAVIAAALSVPAAAQAADGNVYAWEHANFQGAYCAWSGNDGDWSTCSPGGSMLNRASSRGTTDTSAATTT